MPRKPSPLQPRKQPVQARSTHTVQAICEATLQVLVEQGLERLTTTRVAERAGVSIGTLYQYYPNKQSLLAAVLRRHLLAVVQAVEQACASVQGRPVAAMAAAVVGAFVDAKLADRAASAALYAVAADAGGAAVVAELTARTQGSLCALLASASDRRFDDLPLLAFVLSTAMVGPVQGLLGGLLPKRAAPAVREHLVALATAYLQGQGAAVRHRRVTAAVSTARHDPLADRPQCP